MSIAIQDGPKPPRAWRPKYPQFMECAVGQWFLVPVPEGVTPRTMQQRLSQLGSYYGTDRDPQDQRRFSTSITAEGIVVERTK